MKACWPDGDLRAYADGELGFDASAEVASHLKVCSHCDGRYRELSQRALWVSNRMSALSEERALVAAVVLPRRISHRRRWVVAGLSLAAALALAFVLLPRRHAAPVAQPAPAAGFATVLPQPLPAQPAVQAPKAPIHHVAARPRRPAPREEFLRLDDDPIETGTVIRVGAENGKVQADLLIGPDGRAHAIRMIANQ